MSPLPSIPAEPTVETLVSEARALALEAGQRCTTAHVLFALTLAPGDAAQTLARAGYSDAVALQAVSRLQPESKAAVADLLACAEASARASGASVALSWHLLGALIRARRTHAHSLLAACGVSSAALSRTVAAQVLSLASPSPDPAVEWVPAGVVERTATREGRRMDSPAASSTPKAQTGALPAWRDPVSETPPSRANPLRLVPAAGSGAAPEGTPPRATDGWDLPADQYPILSQLGRNLSREAAEGRIDPVIGREAEIEAALDVLGKRRANNPLLVGPPGVGKTALAEAIAARLVELHHRGRPQRLVVELDTASLLAGTQLRGSLSEKLTALKDEVRRAAGRIIVFIDEIHTVVGAGQAGEGPHDVANELKAALARGEFPCIGATTHSEYQRYIEKDAALSRRFVPVLIHEPSAAEAYRVVRGVAHRYARHHGVRYLDAALQAAVALTVRHVRGRSLPDKALTALDHAGSTVARQGLDEVGAEAVARAVARMAGLPPERVLASDADRLLRLEEQLATRVVGHDTALRQVADAVRRGWAGLGGGHPLASVLLLGPAGVGKSELARALAEAVFGTDDALVRLDMANLSEPHAVSRLVGAPPGYVGHSEGGQLTEAVRRRPACVVLLESFDRAHSEAQQLVLQVLDQGALTDARGQRVDFGSAIVVLTSQAGFDDAAEARSARGTAGFGAAGGGRDDEPSAEAVLQRARRALVPELWGRLDAPVLLRPLDADARLQVASLLVARLAERLAGSPGITLECTPAALAQVCSRAEGEPGARGIRQALVRQVETPIGERLLRGELRTGDRLRVGAVTGHLVFEVLSQLDLFTSAPPRPRGTVLTR